MELHSKLGASSCERWSNCPGSLREAEGFENIETSYAKEGSIAHSLAAKWLETEKKPSFKDQVEDMEEAVKEYVDSILLEKELYQASLNETFFVEVKFNLDYIDKSMFGTADAVLYNKIKQEYLIFDYKHGVGIPVEVENNVQLRYYALGALHKLKKPAKKFTFIIIQPRCNHEGGNERRETISFKQLKEYETWLISKVEETKEPKAKLYTGRWCRFCPALLSCSEVKKEKKEVMKLDFKKELSFNLEDLKKALDTIPLLKEWISNVDTFAYAQALKGEKIPGYKLVEKRATRAWREEKEVKLFLEKEYKPERRETFYDLKLKSPAQVEKLVGKKESLKFIDLIIKESSGTVLVPEEDKRQAYLPFKKAEEDFKNFIQ